MAKFLIEVPHEAEREACLWAIRLLLTSGSHWLTHADFGCYDGEHKSWITLEAESKEEARSVLPPVLRPLAKIVKLNKFSLEEVDGMLGQHKP
jgi:hypothetical protein